MELGNRVLPRSFQFRSDVALLSGVQTNLISYFFRLLGRIRKVGRMWL
jgi:hypothetical protein